MGKKPNISAVGYGIRLWMRPVGRVDRPKIVGRYPSKEAAVADTIVLDPAPDKADSYFITDNNGAVLEDWKVKG